jgi:hypothetical protein
MSRPHCTLPLGKDPQKLTGYGVGWASEPVWTQRPKEKSFILAMEQTLVIQSIVTIDYWLINSSIILSKLRWPLHTNHWAMPWLRLLVIGLSSQKTRSVHVELVVALGQVFLKIFWFSPISIIPPCLFLLIYHLGNEQ